MEDSVKSDPDVDLVALARKAFEDYYARCFWYMDPGFEIEKEHLELVAEGLRRHGDRRAFQLAQRLCL